MAWTSPSSLGECRVDLHPDCDADAIGADRLSFDRPGPGELTPCAFPLSRMTYSLAEFEPLGTGLIKIVHRFLYLVAIHLLPAGTLSVFHVPSPWP